MSNFYECTKMNYCIFFLIRNFRTVSFFGDFYIPALKLTKNPCSNFLLNEYSKRKIMS